MKNFLIKIVRFVDSFQICLVSLVAVPFIMFCYFTGQYEISKTGMYLSLELCFFGSVIELFLHHERRILRWWSGGLIGNTPKPTITRFPGGEYYEWPQPPDDKKD